MQITRYTDYALRVLIYLAVNDNRKSTIQEIAQSYSISKNHLMKIVQFLNNEGYLIATRGKSGGIKLPTSANQLNIGTLVRSLESHSNLVECFAEANQCVITPNCQLKKIFKQAVESFYRTLDQYTLQDLVNQSTQPALANSLGISIKQQFHTERESST